MHTKYNNYWHKPHRNNLEKKKKSYYVYTYEKPSSYNNNNIRSQMLLYCEMHAEINFRLADFNAFRRVKRTGTLHFKGSVNTMAVKYDLTETPEKPEF